MNTRPSSDPATAGAGLPAHERVYRQLRDRVLFGELAPGQAVTIQGLTDALRVGMTPVREALRRLTAEGALAFLGNRRIVVPELDEHAISQLSVARLALEPDLARLAVEAVSDDDITQLADTDTRLDAAIRQGDVRGYLIENHRFHADLYALAQTPILTEMVDRLWLRFGPSLRVVCGQIGTRNLPDRHKDVLTALSARDADAAASAIAADITQGMDQIREGLARFD